MALGDKLAKLRKENHCTQEQLAQQLGVSRQAISKWESDLTYPETDKLIRLSELFHCSLDYLLKAEEEDPGSWQTDTETAPTGKRLRERKSEKTLCGMPLWHIGRNARGFVAVGLNAKGVIAVGLRAQGVVSLGLLSMGIVSLGLLSLGLISLGMLALGCLSAGSISVGVFATGAISLGIISLGAIAVGDFSVGALAVGKYFAMGDHARAMVAIGDTEAIGQVLQRIGSLSAQDVLRVKQSLDQIVPAYLAWAGEIIKLFL